MTVINFGASLQYKILLIAQMEFTNPKRDKFLYVMCFSWSASYLASLLSFSWLIKLNYFFGLGGWGWILLYRWWSFVFPPFPLEDTGNLRCTQLSKWKLEALMIRQISVISQFGQHDLFVWSLFVLWYIKVKHLHQEYGNNGKCIPAINQNSDKLGLC